MPTRRKREANEVLGVESTLTSRGQTTIPRPIRRALKLSAKRLAAITKLAFDVIPQDPTRAVYRQGDTLGGEYTHWFCAVFFQQYRLFFRYSSDDKTVIYVWVNDDRSRRAYGSKTDAYRVFRRMLAAGDPPDTWDHLLSHATRNTRRMRRALPDDPDV